MQTRAEFLAVLSRNERNFRLHALVNTRSFGGTVEEERETGEREKKHVPARWKRPVRSSLLESGKRQPSNYSESGRIIPTKQGCNDQDQFGHESSLPTLN